MATATTIANQALDALGKPRLVDLDTDTTFEATLAKVAYPEIRDEVLREHPWNCALTRRVLAENMLLQTEVFDNASWIKTNATVSADADRAPNGLTVADELDDSDGVNEGTVDQAAAVPNDTKSHTFSIHLKQGTAAVTRVRIEYTGGSGIGSNIDVTWAATPIVSAGTITDVGGGWWRIVVTLANNGTGNTSCKVTISPAGATGSATGTVFAWGAQLSQTEGVVGYASTTTVASRPVFPQFGRKFAWLLPADFIAVYDVNEGDLDYQVENDHILYEFAEVNLRYVFQQTDANIIDVLLRDVIAMKLAMRLSIPLSGSDDRKKEIKDLLDRAETNARRRDAQEDGEDPAVEDSWILARASFGTSARFLRR